MVAHHKKRADGTYAYVHRTGQSGPGKEQDRHVDNLKTLLQRAFVDGLPFVIKALSGGRDRTVTFGPGGRAVGWSYLLAEELWPVVRSAQTQPSGVA